MSNNPPLSPLPLLLTRPVVAARRFIADLPRHLANRLDIIETPLLRIEPTGALVRLTDRDVVVFTSTNGVRFAPLGNERAAFCVGQATTEAARERGWDADQLGETVDDLIQNMPGLPLDQRLLHLSGTHVRGDIVGHVRQMGSDAERIAIYDQVACNLTDTARAVLGGDLPVLIPLFSPRTTVQLFSHAVPFQRAQLLALSNAIADCVPEPLRKDVIVSSAPDGGSMVKALDETVQRLASG